MKDDKRKELGERIIKLVKKSTGQNEGVFADGGALINQDIYPEILSPNFSEGTLYADCTIINVGPNKNGIKIPVTSETTRSKTSVRGGFRAYVVGEGVAKTANTGSFALLDLVLNKEAVVIPCTDELLQDSTAIAGYMNISAKEGLNALLDDSILHGNGLCVGIDGHPSTGFTSLTDPMTLAELHNFFDLYYGGKNGKWYMSKVRFGQVLDLFDAIVTAGTGGGSIYLTVTNGVYYLFGYPIVIADTMLDNEIALLDLTQYVIAQKPMTTAVNESIKWVEDEKYFRYVVRVNGTGIWADGGITLADGSVVHPFVMADTFEASSSSSSSSQSVSSSSSYIENQSSSSSDSSSTPSSVSNSSVSQSTPSSVSNSSDSSVSNSSSSMSHSTASSSSTEEESSKSSDSGSESSDSSESTDDSASSESSDG